MTLHGTFDAASCDIDAFRALIDQTLDPVQVPLANGVFTPTAAEADFSRKVIEAFEAAEAAGSASIQLDGYFIDYPIVEKARRVVALADAVAASKR